MGPTPTFPHPPPAGYPRRIASFKCRKLSSQVRASDFASSFSLLNGDPPHPAIPCLHLETAPSAPRGGRGLGGGEGGRGTDSPRVRPKESPPFGNPGNPAHACEDHGRAWKQPPSLDIFPSVGGGFPPCLTFRGTEKEGGAERSSGAGRLLSHLTPKHSTGHGGSRAVGWGGVGWGGDGGLLRTPPVFPPLDTCLEPMKS